MTSAIPKLRQLAALEAERVELELRRQRLLTEARAARRLHEEARRTSDREMAVDAIERTALLAGELSVINRRLTEVETLLTPHRSAP